MGNKINQAFSKIWFLIIPIVLIAGGFLVWQYLGMPEQGTPEELTEGEPTELPENQITYPDVIVANDDLQNWRTYLYGSDFRFKRPDNWIMSESPPILKVTNQDQTVIISLEFVSLEKTGPGYCGDNNSDSPRCELVTVDNVSGFIDWEKLPGQAEIFFTFNTDRGLRVLLTVSSGNIDKDVQKFFKNFLTTFTFGDIPNRTLRLTVPNGGETLCLDENFIIQWEHSGLKTVRLWVRQRGGGSAYDIGTSPADSNEENKPGYGVYVWKVGEITGTIFGLDETGRARTEIGGFQVFGKLAPGVKIEEGDGYEIGILDNENSNIYDVSDDIISIVLCKG